MDASESECSEVSVYCGDKTWQHFSTAFIASNGGKSLGCLSVETRMYSVAITLILLGPNNGRQLAIRHWRHPLRRLDKSNGFI